MINKYEFTDNPKHGIVRKVRKLRETGMAELLRSFSDEIEEISKEDKDMDVEKALMYLLETHPEEFMKFVEENNSNEEVSIISLATNKLWTIEELDELSFTEFDELYNKSLEIIGDVNRFFKNSPLNIQQEKEQTTKTRRSPNRKRKSANENI